MLLSDNQLLSPMDIDFFLADFCKIISISICISSPRKDCFIYYKNVFKQKKVLGIERLSFVKIAYL